MMLSMEKLIKIYFKCANSYNEIILIHRLKMQNSNIESIIEKVLDENKFRIELLTLLSWAHDGKYYKIYGELFSHLKLKE